MDQGTIHNLIIFTGIFTGVNIGTYFSSRNQKMTDDYIIHQTECAIRENDRIEYEREHPEAAFRRRMNPLGLSYY